ncbi:bifunctional lysylphosphatidylglycerol flippase/synthetase MprF [Microbacterium testaceum]|uniref:bifunctional lysylphosphatidylglycerol flippase/synthetase MprF n=1 Tax=Microbacterium testaceum TaxID=2033 RepID=UPI0037FCB88E
MVAVMDKVQAAPEATTSPRPERRVPRWDIPGLVRRWPGTLGVTLAILVVSVITIVTQSTFEAGPFDLRDMLLALVRVDDPLVLLATVVLTLVVCGLAEGLMGTRRLLAAFVGGGLLVCAIGEVIGWFEDNVIPEVSLNVTPDTGAPPIAALLCVAIAASCFASPLWRRRIRIGGVLIAVTMFLYAASASDLYTLIALPVGMATGLVLGGTRAVGIPRSSLREKRVLLAALTAITSIGPVVATLWGSGAGVLSVYSWLSYDPLNVADGLVCAIGSTGAPCPSFAATYIELQPASGWIAALPQLVLLIAAWGILRGRRGALHLAVVVNALTFVAMSVLLMLSETDTLEQLATVRAAYDVADVWQTVVGMVVGAALPLLVAALLIRFRSAVQVRSTPAVRRAFVRTVAIAGLGALALSLVGILMASADFRPWPNVTTVLATLPLRLVPPSLLPPEALVFVPMTGFAQAVWYLPPLLFWGSVVAATARFIVRSGAAEAAPDRERARSLLAAGSGDTLGHMTLWQGNSYWFAVEVEAAIAYRVRGGFAVTLGGAFGPDRDDLSVGAGFVAFCEEQGWTPVFYSVDDAERERLAPLGWSALQVAEEAFLDPQTWTPAGKKRQDVRTATNRAVREGLTARWARWSELSFFDRGQIRAISEAWVSDKTIPEMGFTLGSTDQLDDPEVRLLVARDGAGRITAFTSWIPIHRDGAIAGYALDVMRRRDDAMPGIMEFLIGNAVERLREDGMTVMSLSGSPLARHSVGDEGARGPLDRGLDVISGLLEPAYGFRSLANFKKKFQPDFAPLWMIYPDTTQIPAIAIALVRCYIPGLTLRSAAALAAQLRRPREAASR